MTKERLPLSTEQALARIAGRLPGAYDEMGEVCGRTASTIRAWGDPDKEDDVPIGCAIALDLAYIAEGGEGAPLYEAYGAKLDLAEAARFHDAHRLHEYGVAVIKEGGEAHAAIMKSARPGASFIEKRIAFKEALEAFEKLRDVLPLLEANATPRTEPQHDTPKSENTEGGELLAQAP